MRMVKTLTFLVVVTLLAGPAMAQKTLDVDCSAAGGLNTLAAALARAKSGDTISITGPCPDTKAQVTQDALSIVGAGDEPAVLDGGDQSEPVIMVNGARRVTIQNVTVMNGQHGVLAAKGAAVTVANVMAQGNAQDGFSIDEGATARLSDCTAQDNGDDGFGVLRSSNATFSGTISSTGNGDDGIAVVLNANGTFSGAQVSATNNGQSETFEGNVIGDGIHVTTASNLFVSNSTIEATGNADDGIALSRNATFLAAAPAEGSPVTINVMTNAEDGVEVVSISSFSAIGSNLTLTISGNGRRAFNVDLSAVNLFAATVECEEIPTENTCP